jgi:hypothetical protein
VSAASTTGDVDCPKLNDNDNGANANQEESLRALGNSNDGKGCHRGISHAFSCIPPRRAVKKYTVVGVYTIWRLPSISGKAWLHLHKTRLGVDSKSTSAVLLRAPKRRLGCLHSCSIQPYSKHCHDLLKIIQEDDYMI